MKRRRLLSAGSAVLGTFLCGCQRSDAPSGGTDESASTAGTPSPEPTPNPTPTTTAVPRTDETRFPDSDTTDTATTATTTRVIGHELTVGDRSCASGNEPEGSLRIDERAVLASGTVVGSDGCTTARIEEATYDSAADRLRVVVGIVSTTSSGTVCTQCLSAIEYEARVAFEGSSPERVVRIERGATGEQRTTIGTR